MTAGVRHEVIRSANRRKTVQARLVDGVVRVSIPARMTKAEEDRWVAVMVGRFERRAATAPIDLEGRAEILSARHCLPRPDSICWVDNQQWRWGSCTPADRSIRLSTRLAGCPPWVVDYVIVHELAHLAVAGHGPRFWALVNRYPLAERARGFLMAKGLDHAGPPDGALTGGHCAGSDGEGATPGVASPRARPLRRRPAPPAPPGGDPQTLW